LNPEIHVRGEDQICFRIHNCTFLDSAKRFPTLVCKMHNSMLTGIFEVYFGEIELQEEDSFISGCRSCNYTLVRIQKPFGR
jgi:predicted ArsR family transcriptional regulator